MASIKKIFKISLLVFGIFITLLFIIGIFGVKKENKENAEYFSLNKTSIISDIQANIDEGNFDVARDSSEKYLVSNDEDFQEIHNLITQKVNEKRDKELLAENKNREQELLAAKRQTEYEFNQVTEIVKSQIVAEGYPAPELYEHKNDFFIVTIKLKSDLVIESLAKATAVDVVQIIYNVFKNTKYSDDNIRVSLTGDARPGFVKEYGSARYSRITGEIDWFPPKS